MSRAVARRETAVRHFERISSPAADAREELKLVGEPGRARPFAKWVGGKTSSLELLRKYVPKKIRTYFEPMVGGGALFFALANEARFENAVVSDINPNLIVTYNMIKQDHLRLAEMLSKMRNNKREFLRIRAKQVHWSKPFEVAARFIYLNKTAFNGLWRENKKGQMNVPFGHYKNPCICDTDNLRACAHALRNAQPTTAHYAALVVETNHHRLSKRDFIYFDPPYIPVSETSNFTGFTGGSWAKSEHERLAAFFSQLAKKKVPMMLSNSDTKLARKLYKDFDIVKTKVRRNVSCKGDGRAPVGEILVLANL